MMVPVFSATLIASRLSKQGSIFEVLEVPLGQKDEVSAAQRCGSGVA
jgi:hypothetical protein